MYGDPVGTIYITQSGYLTTTSITNINKTVTESHRVFNIHLISSSTASVLTISNGQTGNVMIKITGTINIGVTFDFGINGMTFPAGAYVTVDNNIVSASIACRREQF